MDPYAPCPCGSGKKVKFCCQSILPEMAKIERFQENNQPRMALQLIDKLLKNHSNNGWLVSQRAMALFNEERFEEARDSLLPFLRKQQDHPMANALLAIAVTETEPIDKSKKVIHRAFLKSMNHEPELCAILADRLAVHHIEQGQSMAARQHLAMVLRLGNDEDRPRALQAMLELDSDPDVPYPLRGSHPLPVYEPSEELQPPFKKAQRLFIHGCFSEAADLLEEIAEKDSQSPQLWHTLGLMRAWDGDESRAAEALHRAAGLYGDIDTAVDVETVAQVLDRRSPENVLSVRVRTYYVESLSRLLTRLDNEDRFSRAPLRSDEMQESLSAIFEILDRPLPTRDELEELTLDSVPRSIGRLMLMDQIGEDVRPTAHLTGLEGERLEQIRKLFEETGGDLVEAFTLEDESQDLLGRISKDEVKLTDELYFAPQTPVKVRERLKRESLQRCIDEAWMHGPQEALGGKSPAEAARDESLKIQLAAAVRVFDAYLDRRDVILDRKALRERLGVEAARKITIREDQDLNTLSMMRLQQLDLEELSDEMFERVMHRALVVKHCGHGYRVLREFVTNRSELVNRSPKEARSAYQALADICNRSLREEESLQWIRRGFEFSQAHGASFEELALWKLRELVFRLRDRESPELKELLLELWNHYGAKLPPVRERLKELVAAFNFTPPWEQGIVTPQTVSQGSNVWTSEAEQAEGEKKLWLPD